MPYVAGVDLGTTYSAAAIVGPEGLAAVDLGTRATVMPSVVAVRADGEVLTGATAERRLVLEPSRAAREFKRRLGDPTPLLLGGVPYGAETLSGHLLRSIVGLVTERQGEPPAVVGLSHPANYGSYKLGLLEEAARVADIPVVVFVPEPVAAAVHYSLSARVAVGELVAVYDLGGGTFDVSVVRSTGDGFEVVGSPDGIDRFGGIDMDEAVLGHVRTVLGDALLTVDQSDPAVLSALARLREECRNAKEALSGDTDVTIPVMLPGLHTEVRLTRAEFEDMIRPRIRDTIAVLQRTVASAGIEMDDLARILLIGGSSRVPLVGEMVRQATGRPVGLDSHPKLSVALGTARVAATSLGDASVVTTVSSAPEPPEAEIPQREPEPEVVAPEPESKPEPEAAKSEPEPKPEPEPDPEPIEPELIAAELEPVEQELTAAVPVEAEVAEAESRNRRPLIVAAALIAVAAVVLGINYFGGKDAPSAAPETTVPPASETTSAAAAYVPPPVVGPEPSDRVLAFYYTSNSSLDFDGGWAVWDSSGASPPDDICCDYYPQLGPYSSNDPAVIDQHFAWFRQAGIGIVGYEWYEQGIGEDRLVPTVLDAAERYGLKVAFVINHYADRSVDTLATNVEYLYNNYGDHPAFYLANSETPHQGAGPKGLFLLRDPGQAAGGGAGGLGYWSPAIEEIHNLPQGGVVLAASAEPRYITQGGFDGLFSGPDSSSDAFGWATVLPDGAWYVPTVLPGVETRKNGNPGNLPRDDGGLYLDRWNTALGMGVEPNIVAIRSFNNWVDGSQLEPAVSGRDSGSGFTYSDYGSLGEEGYLDLTVQSIASMDNLPAVNPVDLQISISSSSDHTTLYFIEAQWVRPTEVSFVGVAGDHRDLFRYEGFVGATVQQGVSTAEAGDTVALVFNIGMVPGDTDPNFTVDKGCLGVTTVEVYDNRGFLDPVLLMTATLQPEDCGGIPETFTISLADLGIGGDGG